MNKPKKDNVGNKTKQTSYETTHQHSCDTSLESTDFAVMQLFK